MPYPSSSDVSASQPTAAAHYNTLRADALRLGQSAADGLNIGDLLHRHDVNLTLQYLAANRVRVPASTATPVYLVIDGAIVCATANVDLSAGSAPSGAAAWWYVFAKRTAGATTFTLDINTSPTPPSLARRIGRFYWDGSKIQKLQTETENFLNTSLGIANTILAQGRLTLAASTPVPSSNITGATEVFYTPYLGNWISLYQEGGIWRPMQFTETYISLAGCPADTNYDIFGYNNAGSLALETAAWSNAATRATALALQDGIYVKSGDPTRRYLGSMRTTATAGQCEDSHSRRYLWNYLNQVQRKLYAADQTSHTYSAVAYRSWNNDNNVRYHFVVGLPVSIWTTITLCGYVNASTQEIYAGGLDTNSEGYKFYGFAWNSNTTLSTRTGTSIWEITPGYHYMQVIERFGNASYVGYCNEVYSPGEFLG